MPMSETELLKRDAKRHIGEELLASVLEMKANKRGRTHQVKVSIIAQTRHKTGLSQAEFTALLGISR